MSKKKPTRRKFTGKKEDMIIVRGVHPNDSREPKVQYSFMASDYLISQLPCVGDLISVMTKYGKRVLFVTDIVKWQDGCFVPEQLARCLYQGEKWKDFEYEIEE